MLERDSGEDSIHHQRAGGLSLAHKAAQDVPVPFAGLKYPESTASSQARLFSCCSARG
jgi:hypothetical protein